MNSMEWKSEYIFKIFLQEKLFFIILNFLLFSNSKDMRVDLKH
jgi:hypothetical protein